MIDISHGTQWGSCFLFHNSDEMTFYRILYRSLSTHLSIYNNSKSEKKKMFNIKFSSIHTHFISFLSLSLSRFKVKTFQNSAWFKWIVSMICSARWKREHECEPLDLMVLLTLIFNEWIEYNSNILHYRYVILKYSTPIYWTWQMCFWLYFCFHKILLTINQNAA